MNSGFPACGAHLVGRDLGHEPDLDRDPRDRVLLDAHLLQGEGVDDVLAGEGDERGPVHRQVELVDGRDVVLRRGVLAVEAEGIRLRVDELEVGPPEEAVRPRVVDVPGELLRHHADPGGLPGGGRCSTRSAQSGIDRPTRSGASATATADLEPGRGVAGHAGVVGHGVPLPPEAHQHVGEERPPADEEHRHQHVDEAEGPVQCRPVLDAS